MKTIILSLFLGAAFISIGYSQNILTSTKIKLLDSIATQDVPPKAPGIATAIIQYGKVIYQKCAGYADLTDSFQMISESGFPNYSRMSKRKSPSKVC